MSLLTRVLVSWRESLTNQRNHGLSLTRVKTVSRVVHVSRTSSARLMARAFARLAALGLLVLAAADETPWEDEGVTVLNSVNFDHFINTHRLVMVKFYAPW